MVIGECRFSFVHVFEPKETPQKDLKYSISVMIPKSNAQLTNQVNEAVQAAIQKGLELGRITKAMVPRLKLPLRDGDAEYEAGTRGAEYKDHWFFNASTKDAPGVVDSKRQPIMSSDDFFSGCYGYVDVGFFAYNNVSVGVGAGLNHVLKTRDGERLDGRVSVDDAFKDLDIPIEPDVLDVDFTG